MEPVAKVIGYTGRIELDSSKLNGTLPKMPDLSKAKASDWTYKTKLEDGIHLVYEVFFHNLVRTER